MTTPTASYVFRENIIDGDPTSGLNQPDLTDLRTWGEWIEQLIVSGALADATWKTTKTLLLADLAHDATAKAVVYLDPTPQNNGFYEKYGASGSGGWNQLTTFLPGAQTVRATDTGASTGASYVMSTSPRLPAGDGQALVIATVPVTNTADAPQIKFDGGSFLTIVSAAGATISSGALVAGMPLVGLITGAGTLYRLTTDYASAASQAAAEAARDLAKDFANKAEDQEVEPGLYSAKHWAAKAAAADAGTGAALARDQSVAAAALSTSSAGLSSQKAADAATAAATAQTAAANAQATARLYATWTGTTGLAAATSTVDGQAAEVPDTDAGTHLQATATGYDGASVPNAGRYHYAVAWSRWLWISASGLSGVSSRLTPIESVVDKSSASLTQTVPSTHKLIADTDTVVGLIGADDAGYAPGAVLSDGTVAFEKTRIGKQTIGTATTESIEGNYDWSVTDAADNVVLGVKDNELQAGGFSASRMADYQNKLKASAYVRQPVSGVQQPTADYNTIVQYGQSLALGQEAWPALSKTQQFGNLMLGGDVRPVSMSNPGWTQISPTGFQPLIARVRANAGATFYTDAEVAALAPGDISVGEVPAIGMANMSSWLIGRKALATPKPFVVLCPAVGGMTIEQLSKTNTQDATDRYSRVTAGVTQAHAAATALGKTHVVTAIVWMQGEYDYDTTHGSTKATKALYKAALAQLRTDLVTDIKAITGQADDPLFILYQTGASWVRDIDSAGAAGLHVGMAQLEFALENPGKVVMAGSTYSGTDKGGHLDPNGSRWFGAYLSKAYVRAAIDGRRFRPLSPTKIEAITTKLIRVHFHVPEPPLVFDASYVVTTATSYGARGFRVTDTAGAVGIECVSIVQDTIVEIALSRPMDAASAKVWYASQTGSAGNGNLRDSDATIARDLYEYSAGTGQYAAANIAGLVGNPYPLGNWAVAFFLPVGYSE